MNDLFSIIYYPLIYAVNWFSDLFQNTGMTELYLSIIFIVLSIRFLVSPIFGVSRGSDKARSKDE